MTTSRDAVAVIKKDHRTIEALFSRFERSLRAAEKKRLAGEILRELSVHAVVEEQLVYPVLRRRLEGREGAVLLALEEHHAAKVALTEIEKLPATHERFDPKVRVLIETVRHHVEEEERGLLPAMQRAFSRDELRDLGATLEAAKRIAPTRPHPGAPDEPPGNLFAGLAASPLDRGRQAVGRGVDAIVERGRGLVGAALRRGEEAVRGRARYDERAGEALRAVDGAATAAARRTRHVARTAGARARGVAAKGRQAVRAAGVPLH